MFISRMRACVIFFVFILVLAFTIFTSVKDSSILSVFTGTEYNAELPLIQGARLLEGNMLHSNVCSQERRKSLLRKMCQLYQQSNQPVQKSVPKLIVDHHHKVAYCYIAKAGCSSWKTIMANVSSAGKVKQGMSLGELRGLHASMKKYGLEEMRYNETIADYTKFMVVRHPLDRLVSAYRDKMRGGDVTYNKYAKSVVEKFRTNEVPNNDTFPTFPEFIKMILAKESLSTNEHWNSYFFRCEPCSIHYDYILKLETMDHDMDIVLSKVFSQDMQYITEKKLNSLAPSGETPGTFSKQLTPFEEISQEEIKAITKRHQYESDFFGYTFDEKSLLAGCCDGQSISNGTASSTSTGIALSEQNCCC